ncbi:MAG: DNA mismatch repair endonuclease MutL [Oscillibacter sp.]|nr:DNA mismatch repair endonuclease MutL [Oscillibacter sp.]
MPQIQQLSPHVADLIAAGEVVERPASVVKELIENAIDAGASAVVVELQNGGMSLIRVTDDGCGIAPEELPTAFLRHATSKLRRPEDLAAIGTLGFRGEALAAISAVSRLDVFTRRKGARLGASLHLEGGVPGPVEEAGCPEGTTFAIRNLFYNTPARLKFMKTDSAEAAAAAAVIAQIALSHPEVSIRYLRDGKEELHTPGDGKLLSAVYAARGRDFALHLTEVEGGGENVSVRGFVTEPLSGRGNRAMQTFFCCGRMIKSALLTAALEEAYANRQMKGKYPGCVLHIDLPLHLVDVNVHPAKTVVKFVNERAVFSAVHHTVKDALDAGGRKAAGTAVQTPTGRLNDVPATASTPPAPKKDFYRTMDAKTFREKAAASAGRAPVTPRTASPEPGGRVTFRDSARPSVSPEAALPYTVRAYPPPAETPAPPPPAPEPPEPRPAPAVPEQTALTDKPAPWRFAGEVLRTYIIAEDGDCVWLIDKHAAHERINFDRMKASAEPVMRQRLLAPLAVDLPREQYAALLENLPLLEEFGFEAEDFGAGCLMVRGIPSDLDTGLVRETLEELSEKLLTTGGADPSAARDALLHTMACKAAIKGGWTSDPSELKALIEKVQSGEVQYCPHGRPVKVKLSRYEIEKMFKRA